MIGVYRYLEATEGPERALAGMQDWTKNEKAMESTSKEESTVTAIEAPTEEAKESKIEDVEVIRIAPQKERSSTLVNSYHQNNPIHRVLLYHAL